LAIESTSNWSLQAFPCAKIDGEVNPENKVEVVSPGKENQDRDYRYKRSEYAARGIAEYWIVDLERAQVVALTLVDGLYEEAVYQ
jgi:Uma2 family endonuclease